MPEVPVLKALAHEGRRRIVLFVAQGPRTAGEIVALFSVSQPAVSRHLRVLRGCGLLRSRRRGRERIYQVNPQAARQAETSLREWFEAFWDAQLQSLKRYLEEPQEEKQAERSPHALRPRRLRKRDRGAHHA